MKNTLTIHLEPTEGITINFWSKKPGLQNEIEERKFEFNFRSAEKRSQYTEEYEKLLLDCIQGDQTLFVSGEEVRAMWKFIDPIIMAWQENKVPLFAYKPDTLGAVKKSEQKERTLHATSAVKKVIGVVGLGKMGANLSRHLMEKEWEVVGWNRTDEVTKKMTEEGLKSVYSIKELVDWKD